MLLTLLIIYPTLAFIKKSRDNSLMNRVAAALCDEFVRYQFPFVHWFSEQMVHLQRGGQGCECHRAECEAGVAVNCWYKGRVIRVAYQHAGKTLDDMVAHVSWGSMVEKNRYYVCCSLL